VLLFGSLTRDPETVDDIDVSIIMHQHREIPSGEGEYRAFLDTCRDYVKANDLTVQRRSIMDSPAEDVKRNIRGRFSKLDRVSISDITKQYIEDQSAVLYAIYIDEEVGPKYKVEYNGILDVDASAAEGKVRLHDAQPKQSVAS
jgi:hypothetical protein